MIFYSIALRIQRTQLFFSFSFPHNFSSFLILLCFLFSLFVSFSFFRHSYIQSSIDWESNNNYWYWIYRRWLSSQLIYLVSFQFAISSIASIIESEWKQNIENEQMIYTQETEKRNKGNGVRERERERKKKNGNGVSKRKRIVNWQLTTISRTTTPAHQHVLICFT